MIQRLENEPSPSPLCADEALSSPSEREILADRLLSAEITWEQLQKDSTAGLGEKATAGVILQEARVQLAAYDIFHPE